MVCVQYDKTQINEPQIRQNLRTSKQFSCCTSGSENCMHKTACTAGSGFIRFHASQAGAGALSAGFKQHVAKPVDAQPVRQPLAYGSRCCGVPCGTRVMQAPHTLR
jgi:hypothetical protein